MNLKDLKKYDIVIVNGDILQYLGIIGNAAVLQDIHTKIELTYVDLIDRKANKDEIKWFCENTEHVSFMNPKDSAR